MLKKDALTVDGLLFIDETKLDRQNNEQPRLVFRYGRKHAKAVEELDIADSNLKLVKAEIDEQIRQNPAAFGVEKVTEAAVQNAILRTKEYQTALADMITKKRDVNDMGAIMNGLDHRRTSIGHALTMQQSGYMSGRKL